MKFKFRHISLLVFIVGFLFQQNLGFDSFTNAIFLKIEGEESYEHSYELEFEEDRSNSKLDSGSSSAILNVYGSVHPRYIHKDYTQWIAVDYTPKNRLFILFCCLKLDC